MLWILCCIVQSINILPRMDVLLFFHGKMIKNYFILFLFFSSCSKYSNQQTKQKMESILRGRATLHNGIWKWTKSLRILDTGKLATTNQINWRGRKQWIGDHGGNPYIFMGSGFGMFRVRVLTASALQNTVEGRQSRIHVSAWFYRMAIDWRKHQLLPRH